MKTFIAAIVTLALVVTAMNVNYVYLHRAMDELIRLTSAVSDSNDTQIRSLESHWEQQKPKICLTVGHQKTDLIDTLMIEMRTNLPAFEKTKSILLDTFEKIKASESLSLDGIL